MKMKTKQYKYHGNEGGVLMVALITCLVIGIVLSSYLIMLQSENVSVWRSQGWNQALITAEAGADEAMSHLNSGITTNNLAVNSWVNTGLGKYSKTNYLGDNYFIVTIEIPPAVTNANPVIVS